MKKYTLALLAVLVLSGMDVLAADALQPQQEQIPQSWYDWSKYQASKIGHYVPSWHYWPAIMIGSGPVVNTARNVLQHGDPGYSWTMSPALAAIATPYLVAGGYGLKRLENLLRNKSSGSTNYAYYLPGMLAAFPLPMLLAGALQKAGIENEWVLKRLLGSIYMSPLLLGAGHLAHQYFNPPVSAPQVPVALEPDDMEARYAELKNAVFAKMDPAFVAAFNLKYPRSSVEAVKELASHIDAIRWWSQDIFPPRATARIGSHHILLQGDIAHIISNSGIRIPLGHNLFDPALDEMSNK